MLQIDGDTFHAKWAGRELYTLVPPPAVSPGLENATIMPIPGDLPMAFPSGAIRQDVWDRWLAFDPVVNWRDRVDNLRQLRGILLDAGQKDDYNLHWGHRLLNHHLNEAGIAHEFTENPGNHGGRANERYQVALKWLGQVLEHQ